MGFHFLSTMKIMQSESLSFCYFDHFHLKLAIENMDNPLTHILFYFWHEHMSNPLPLPFIHFPFLTSLSKESHFGTNNLNLHSILVHTLHLTIERFLTT
jgi:hypothetical protein